MRISGIYAEEDLKGANKETSVEGLVTAYEALWLRSRAVFPVIGERFGFFTKLLKQKSTSRFLKKMEKQLKDMTPDISQEERIKILQAFEEQEFRLIGSRLRAFNFFAERNYTASTEDFIREAKGFDRDIQIYDISQALRNVWIMNSIQILFGIGVQLTPSIFGYSMLYPYSDNYIDDIAISLNDKISFCERLTHRLSGKYLIPLNHHEEKVYDLIGKIEQEFPRVLNPQVYDGLLFIHRAQVKSFNQQRQYYPQQRVEPLSISIEKGGTSVLADGYLVKGRLSEEEAFFLFGYGVFLQFIDDLQDLRDDMDNNHETVFTEAFREGKLEEASNRVFSFIDEALVYTDIFKSPDAKRLVDIIRECCKQMLLEAIASNRGLYSRKYIKALEEYSLYRFVYYKRLKKRLQRIFNSKELSLLSRAMQFSM